MENLKNEECEICEIGNKKFTVITRISDNSLEKDKLIKLIVEYAFRELNDRKNNDYGK